MIQIHGWSVEEKKLIAIKVEELPATVHEWPREAPLWIDLSNPTPEEEALILTKFLPVHPLTLEDLTKPRREPSQGAHLPKVEEFRDYLLVIVNPLPHLDCRKKYRSKDRPQLSGILTREVLITHHYTELASVNSVQKYIQRHHDCGSRGPDYVFHLILDSIVDEYAPVVETLADRLDRLENHLFKEPTPVLLTRLLRMKRQVAFLRKTLILEREVLARLTRGEFSLVDQREMAYYRNVYDHLVRYTELVESAREMVSDLMQTHLAATSNKLNEVMKVLTMISTVVLPMTLVAGVYGMNFDKIPELKWDYGYPFALSLMLITALTALGLFKWRRWI